MEIKLPKAKPNKATTLIVHVPKETEVIFLVPKGNRCRVYGATNKNAFYLINSLVIDMHNYTGFGRYVDCGRKKDEGFRFLNCIGVNYIKFIIYGNKTTKS